MKLLNLLALVVFLNIPADAIAQTVHYDIVIGGRTVGSVKVLDDDSEPESARRQIDAEVSIPFYSGSLRSENQFQDGALKTSATEYRVNGKVKEKVHTSSTSLRHYQVDFFGSGPAVETRKDVKHGITKTIVNLYYEEPVNVNAVYSEKYGQICKVESLGNSRYGVIMPSGKQTVYTYVDGKCVEVIVELAGVKLKILRKEIRLARK